MRAQNLLLALSSLGIVSLVLSTHPVRAEGCDLPTGQISDILLEFYVPNETCDSLIYWVIDPDHKNALDPNHEIFKTPSDTKCKRYRSSQIDFGSNNEDGIESCDVIQVFNSEEERQHKLAKHSMTAVILGPDRVMIYGRTTRFTVTSKGLEGRRQIRYSNDGEWRNY